MRWLSIQVKVDTFPIGSTFEICLKLSPVNLWIPINDSLLHRQQPGHNFSIEEFRITIDQITSLLSGVTILSCGSHFTVAVRVIPLTYRDDYQTYVFSSFQKKILPPFYASHCVCQRDRHSQNANNFLEQRYFIDLRQPTSQLSSCHVE